MSYGAVVRDRRGMTLIEMVVALAIFTGIVGMALTFLNEQSRAFRRGAERTNLGQNLRYAAEMLEKDVRSLGTHLADNQPGLVYADDEVIAFNADYVSNIANDPFAVYYDPDAPGGSVTAPTAAQRSTVPRSAFAYPSVEYTDASGTNGAAELIVLFFTPDSSTTRADDYALYRRVNAMAPELISRNLVRTEGAPFFEYLRVAASTSGIATVPPTGLPLAHTEPLHGSAADTGLAAVIDSVRGVRVRFSATNGRNGSAERQRAMTRLIWVPNAGQAARRTCGDEPLLQSGVNASVSLLQSGEPAVTLTWSASVDELGGEEDVVRYVLWRRIDAEPRWGDPYLSLPSGNVTYLYEDAAVTSGSMTSVVRLRPCRRSSATNPSPIGSISSWANVANRHHDVANMRLVRLRRLAGRVFARHVGHTINSTSTFFSDVGQRLV